MSTTPMYDAVVQDLDIDPKQIAARPAWSFEVAERVRKHRKKAERSAASKQRTKQSASSQPRAPKPPVTARRAEETLPRPAAAAT